MESGVLSLVAITVEEGMVSAPSLTVPFLPLANNFTVISHLSGQRLFHHVDSSILFVKDDDILTLTL